MKQFNQNIKIKIKKSKLLIINQRRLLIGLDNLLEFVNISTGEVGHLGLRLEENESGHGGHLKKII